MLALFCMEGGWFLTGTAGVLLQGLLLGLAPGTESPLNK